MTTMPFLRTFRARLTLRWTVAFGLLLAVANTAIYIGARVYLQRDLDANVRTWPPPRSPRPPTAADLHLHELPTEALGHGEYTDKFVPVLEADGRVRVRVAIADAARAAEPGCGGRPAAGPARRGAGSSTCPSAAVPAGRPC